MCIRDRHNGRSIVFNGGWHDAGDLSQQLIQTAEVTWALFELAGALEDEEHAALRLRLREEALWGLDYVLKSRFGEDVYKRQRPADPQGSRYGA